MVEKILEKFKIPYWRLSDIEDEDDCIFCLNNKLYYIYYYRNTFHLREVLTNNDEDKKNICDTEKLKEIEETILKLMKIKQNKAHSKEKENTDI